MPPPILCGRYFHSTASNLRLDIQTDALLRFPPISAKLILQLPKNKCEVLL